MNGNKQSVRRVSTAFTMRCLMALPIAALGLALVGCGGSSTSPDISPPPGPVCGAGEARCTPSPTMPPPGGITVTGAAGFRFSVAAGHPTTVPQYTDTLTPEVAPPGQAYVDIPLTVTNLQADREAPLMDLLAPANAPAVYDALPSSQVPAGSCATTVNGYTSPDGSCLDQGLTGELLLPDGDDVQADLNLMQTPQVSAGGSAQLTFYYGPVATSFAVSNLRLFIGIGSGPQMVAVPIP